MESARALVHCRGVFAAHSTRSDRRFDPIGEDRRCDLFYAFCSALSTVQYNTCIYVSAQPVHTVRVCCTLSSCEFQCQPIMSTSFRRRVSSRVSSATVPIRRDATAAAAAHTRENRRLSWFFARGAGEVTRGEAVGRAPQRARLWPRRESERTAAAHPPACPSALPRDSLRSHSAHCSNCTPQPHALH